MMGLTKRQSELLDFISAHLTAYGVAPTLDEIGLALNIRGRGAIHRLLTMLVDRGYVTRATYATRGIELVEPVGHDPRDCFCDGCNRVRIRAHQTFIQALQVPAPILGGTNFKAVGIFDRTCWSIGFPYSDHERAKPRPWKSTKQSQPQTVPAQVGK